MSSKLSNNNNNNNKKLIISPQFQQMIEEANNTIQTFKEHIYNYALSKEKEKEEEDGFTSSQQVQELLRQKIICKCSMEDG